MKSVKKRLLQGALGAALAFSIFLVQTVPATSHGPVKRVETEQGDRVQKPRPSQPQSSPGGSNYEVLREADRLYLQGRTEEAERLYRRVKAPFSARPQEFPAVFDDPAQLSTEGLALWEEAEAYIDDGDEDDAFEVLQELVELEPAFGPGYGQLAEMAIEEGDEEDVIPLLEQMSARYPHSADIAMGLARALREDKQRIEASIAARQFAAFNPEHPQAAEFEALADEYLGDFRGKLRERILLRGVAGVAIGAITGGTNTAVIQGIQIAQLMAMGESDLGSAFAEQLVEEFRAQDVLVEDPTIVNYISEMGHEVADLMGRDEFEYEFYVIENPSINAFALPGGKVFVHTGAIMSANSSAELAGLMGHEVAHAVLSHGFQRIVTNNLLANLSREIPLGNVLGTLVSLDYSRAHERQADIIGTRVLNATPYAADGLRNFFVTLAEESSGGPPPFLSTHPVSSDRVEYLETLIVENNYDRYAYEGVEELARVQSRIEQITR